MFINHYEILGVEQDADAVQITAAWKRLLKKYHPDLNQDDQDATEQAVLINKAHEILSDSTKRKKFDQQLENERRKASSQQAADPEKQSEPWPAAQSGGASGQSFDQRTGESYAKYSAGRAKKNRYAVAMSVTGIALGVLTAVPIGLFIVWSISGFDPLGIFRQRDKEFADSRKQEADPNSEIGPEAVKKSDDKELFKKGSKDSSNDTSTNSKKTRLDNGDGKANKLKKSKAPPEKKSGLAEAKKNEPTKNPSEPKKETVTKDLNRAAEPIQPKDLTLLSPPPENAVLAAKKKIGEAFKQKFQTADSAKGLERLERLRDLSLEISKLAEAEQDAADLYALFEVSLDIGRRSCFAKETLQIVNEFESRFEIDGLGIRLQLFQYWRGKLATIIPDPAGRKNAALRLAFASEPFVYRAVLEQKWALAADFAEMLRMLYSLADREKNSLQYVRIEKELESLTEQKKQVDSALTMLKQNPGDSEDNFAVGAYYCFQLGDWQSGLPYLEKGNYSELAECAREDLASELDDQSIGDKWWLVASSPDSTEYRSALSRRAAEKYGQALSRTSGIQREILRKRILESNKLEPNILVKARSFVHLLNLFNSDSVRFLDYLNKTWQNDIRELFDVAIQADGCNVECNIPTGYEHKLILFPKIDVRKQKIVVDFTVKVGEFNVGLRPADLHPRGAAVDMNFKTEERYRVEVWIEGNVAKCTVNGNSTGFIQKPSWLGYYSLSFSRECHVVIHELVFADFPSP